MNNRIFSIIGWIGTALVVVALAIWVLSRTSYALGPQWDQYRFYLALAGLVCMLIYMTSQWREVARLFSRRQAQYGTLAVTSVVIVLGILVAINYIGKQQNKRWDLTAAKQFSLSDQTRNVVSKLDAPLHVLVFALSPEFQVYQDRLKEYEYLSKQVTTEYIDPDQKQTLARQNEITTLPTMIFQYKDRSERVTSNTEQDITNAIIKVVTGQQKKIYFTQGHGEKDATGADRGGYNAISEALKKENYTVDKLVLGQVTAVPEDAAIVVIAGPSLDFYPPEIETLKKYLDKQGKLLLELDPPDKADAPAMTNLVGLAHDWGFDVGNNIIVDVSGMGQLFGASPGMPVTTSYPTHAITERFKNVMTMYPLTRSVGAVSGGVNGHNPQPVVETSQRSWAETNLKGLFSNQEPAFDEKTDKRGPIPLASAVSTPATPPDPSKPPDPNAPKPAETRIVVIGDSDFVSNSYAGFAGNKDFFMNVIGWLSQQENLISVRPKEAQDRRLTMTSGQQQLVGWFALLGLPGLVFASGAYSWWRRR